METPGAGFLVGDRVDLYDTFFREWRGAYVVIGVPSENCKFYRIQNLGTNSKQHVREKNLRRARLGPWRLESLYR